MPEGLKTYIDLEIKAAEELLAVGEPDAAFSRLERAHVLAQSITMDHTRVHIRMLKMGWKRRDVREVWGQIVRVIGAATKTPFGIYPKGNTGGSNVYFFKKMTVPADLQEIIDRAGR